jgi:hypothetical protein
MSASNTAGAAAMPTVSRTAATIPIVFAVVADPVGDGFVASLSRGFGTCCLRFKTGVATTPARLASGTCCLRFKTGVATTPARLASGWLARLYREGVEPSGSLQKVSDRSIILLFWIYPGARGVSF